MFQYEKNNNIPTGFYHALKLTKLFDLIKSL